MFDLHVHSTHSDGKLTPREIVKSIHEQNVKGFAITDHDNLDAIDECEFYAKSYNIDFIPGIEFGVNYNDREVHLLAYYVEKNNDDLVTLVNKLKDIRNKRTVKIIDRLNELLIDIKDEDLNDYRGTNFTSRSHIAKFLVDNNYTKNMEESFNKYLGPRGLAYIKKDEVEISEVIDISKNAGAVLVLAHPFRLDNDEIKDIAALGIDGVEVINSKHELKDIKRIYNLANELKLIPTAGSDCHGRKYDNNILLGKYLTPNSSIERIKALHNFRK